MGPRELKRTDAVGHGIAFESLLKLGAHKVVSRATVDQDRKVDVEPEKINDSGNQDQANGAGIEVVHELLHGQAAANIQKLPKIPDHSHTNRSNSEETDHLDTISKHQVRRQHMQ